MPSAAAGVDGTLFKMGLLMADAKGVRGIS